MKDKTLLISDLDGTLLGDDDALTRFADWYHERRGEYVLAYSSGRFHESIAESIRTTRLPKPDYVIGGVGTQMRRFATGEILVDWEEMPLQRWDDLRIRSLLARVPQLEPQPAKYQSRRKISYFLPEASSSELDQIAELLRAAEMNAELLYSSRLHLDVVPAGMNKGTAARFLARCVAADCRRVIVSGDTGNDLHMFRQPFLGVVVGNAHPELKDLAGDKVYVSPHSFAEGVLDGIRYWLARGLAPTG